MKTINKHITIHNCAKIFALSVGMFLLPSCIYDDLSNCPQGLNVRLFSKTACAADSVFPQFSDLKLFVFDKNEKLVSFQDIDNEIDTRSFNQMLAVRDGVFSVVAWAGLGAQEFEILPLKTEIVTKSDLLFRLKHASQQAAAIDGKRVYFGESSAAFLPDPARYGSVYENVAVNMQEITNRFTIQIEGLPHDDDYEVKIESSNGAMSVGGEIAPDETVVYNSQPTFTGSVLEAQFTLLKLAFGTNTALIIRDKRLNKELYRGDLLGTLLLKNPNVNPACDHDFTIRLTTRDQCECGTYMIVEIWVNNWLVHSYDSDL
ncbi:MAG: FimB/Mfa2 family fimbrial subunit [Paludibacter sp.]|jgi:hypothetical protein|nr:FimB/Mfa2 family fimbrial subunit [Paludibacter sp.]